MTTETSQVPPTDQLPNMPATSPAAPEIEATLRDENRALAVRLREALLASDASIAPELVSGTTVVEIEASFAAARAIAARVRDSIRQELASSPIPAGAPGRSIGGPANARDKIRAGLSQPLGSVVP